MIVGLSCDSPTENRRFRDKHDFPFDLLSDTNRRVSMMYGAAEGPETEYPRRISYLIDPEGRIALAYPKVEPKNHPEQVLRDLERCRGRR